MHASIRILLRWYATHARDLPWRHTRDPYAIFISELMSQQTQVDRVIPKYLSWLNKFPNWESLAQATTVDVLHAWSGLGYNRRGLYAKEAAKQIQLSGIPKTEKEWRAIKGVGPYMAAALSEFSQHQRAIVIDTNVRRVAGRIFLGKPFPTLDDDKNIFQVLDDVTPKKQSHWIIPQAFMDFANAHCLQRKPHCTDCPFKKTCKASWFFLKGGIQTKSSTTKPRETIRDGKQYPDRIYRGRILKLILEKKIISLSQLGVRIDKTYTSQDAPWVHAMCSRLVTDGLLRWKDKKTLTTPKA